MFARLSLVAMLLVPFAIACSSSDDDSTGAEDQNITRGRSGAPGELNGMCGGFAGIVCKEGLECQGRANHPDASGTCLASEGGGQTTCLAMPSCDAGDAQSPTACAPNAGDSCYTRAMCGKTITCQKKVCPTARSINCMPPVDPSNTACGADRAWIQENCDVSFLD